MCRFQQRKGKADHGYDVCREIRPIIAQDADQALSLVWKQHGEYLAEFYGPPLVWKHYPRYKAMSKRTKTFLLQNLEITEIKTAPMWAGGFFTSPHICTLVG